MLTFSRNFSPFRILYISPENANRFSKNESGLGLLYFPAFSMFVDFFYLFPGIFHAIRIPKSITYFIIFHFSWTAQTQITPNDVRLCQPRRSRLDQQLSRIGLKIHLSLVLVTLKPKYNSLFIFYVRHCWNIRICIVLRENVSDCVAFIFAHFSELLHKT